MDVDKTKTDPKSIQESSISSEINQEEPTKGRLQKGSEVKLPAKDKRVSESGDGSCKSSNTIAVLTSSPEIIDIPIKVKADSGAGMSNVNDDSIETDLLGKDKQARISDIHDSASLLKTSTKISFIESQGQSNLENRLYNENVDSESNTDGFENSGCITGSSSLVSGRVTPPTSMLYNPTTIKKKKPKVDLTNCTHLKPFVRGWKREREYHVARVFNCGKWNSCIYYLAPRGRKVRSVHEVPEHLKNKDLTLEDFPFMKELLSLDDPEKEIIRNTEIKLGPATSLIKKLPKVTTIPKVITHQKMVAIPNTSRETETEILAKEMKFKKVPYIGVGGSMVKFTRATLARKCMKRIKDITEDHLEVVNPTIKIEKSVTPVRKRKLNFKSAPLGTFECDTSELTAATISYPQIATFEDKILFNVFRYLELQDLLNAMRVCTKWRDIANNPLLWKTVRLKYFPTHNFKDLCNALHKHGTVHLDMRKICLPRNSENIWVQFNKEITKVDTLKTIELGCCPAVVIEEIAKSNPNLEVLNAVAIKCASINLDPLECLKDIKQLCLKSKFGFTLNSDLSALAKLTNLCHLSLTSVKSLYKLNIEVIAELTGLESLDLGNCTDFPQSFGRNILARLSKLKKLRLEKGEGNCCTLEILDVVSTMPHIEELELINFDINTGFGKALGACKNIKKLLIIPNYVDQIALSYCSLIRGVLKLESSLSHFKWCIILEFQEITEMIFRGRKDAGNEDIIQSILDGSPLLGISPELEILYLPNLEKFFLKRMPTTHVEIIKIPFCDTWNQTITDTFN